MRTTYASEYAEDIGERSRELRLIAAVHEMRIVELEGHLPEATFKALNDGVLPRVSEYEDMPGDFEAAVDAARFKERYRNTGLAIRQMGEDEQFKTIELILDCYEEAVKASARS